MKPVRSLRLRAKLVASYTLLGVCITLVTLIGGRMAQANAYRENLRLGELLRSTQEMATLAESASEEGFAYVVSSGDPEERDTFFQSLHGIETKARSVQDGASITTGEHEALASIVACGERVRLIGPTMFRAHEEVGTVPREVYVAYEDAIDQLNVATAALSSLASLEFEHQLSRARVRSDWLTVLVGLVAVAAAAALGTTLGRRITAPLLSLRSAVLAFGAGGADVRVDKKSDDEIGELATAFERMAAETRRHSEQRFEDIFSSITDALVVCKQDRTIMAVNAACCLASGYAERDIVGRPLSLIFAASDLDEGADQETELKTADGRHVPIRLTASRLRGRGDDGMVLIARDLTERQRLEAQLRTAQKMEAIGRLAGGISHDFNNMLNVILGYAGMLLEGVEPSDPLYVPVSEIQRAGERSAELTQQLLAFSRQQVAERRTLNIGEIVESTLRILHRVVGEDVEVSTHLAAQPCVARLAPGQVEQILMNLAVNARDAMSNGGTLSLTTDVVEVTAAEAERRHGARAGRYARLSVQDTGTGMDAATLQRIFEPFFTTKEQGKGTGLGLATVFGIVHQNDGHIVVSSTVGAGSTFQMYFPESNSAIDDSPSKRLSVHPAPAATTVLLVEDEEQVRDLIGAVLRRRGYRVLAALHPQDALRICREHDGSIELLLTDVIMPQMNGRELADRVLAARPEIKVLYMSGYTDDVVLQRGVSHVAFLQKPITPDALGRKVLGMLTPRRAHESIHPNDQVLGALSRSSGG